MLPSVQAASKILPTTGYRGVIKTINLFIDLWLCCLLYLADKIHELLECVHCHRSPSIDIPWRGPQGKRAFIWFMPIMWFLQTWNNYLLCFIKKQYLQTENSVQSVTSQATEKNYMVMLFESYLFHLIFTFEGDTVLLNNILKWYRAMHNFILRCSFKKVNVWPYSR